MEKKDDTDTDSEEVDADMEKQCHQQGDDLRGRSHCTTWSRCEVEAEGVEKHGGQSFKSSTMKARRLYVLVAEGSVRRIRSENLCPGVPIIALTATARSTVLH